MILLTALALLAYAADWTATLTCVLVYSAWSRDVGRVYAADMRTHYAL
jgi:hypothetical protein